VSRVPYMKLNPHLPKIIETLRENEDHLHPKAIRGAVDELEYMARRIDSLEELAERLITERDDARRQYCRGFTDFCHNPKHDHLSLEQAARRVAKDFGWDCFKENS